MLIFKANKQVPKRRLGLNPLPLPISPTWPSVSFNKNLVRIYTSSMYVRRVYPQCINISVHMRQSICFEGFKASIYLWPIRLSAPMSSKCLSCSTHLLNIFGLIRCRTRLLVVLNVAGAAVSAGGIGSGELSARGG